MSDAPASSAPAGAPSAPAATSAAPQGAAPVHHANLQPREQGKFAGPPDASKAPPATGTPAAEPPKAWKVGNREFKSPEELALYASEADAERGALNEWQKRAIEAEAKRKEYEARLKDPSALVTEEMRQRFVMEEVKRFQEAEALKKMDPETRALYLYTKEQEKKAAEAEAKLRQYEEQQAEAKRKSDEEATLKQQQAAQEEMRKTLVNAVKMAGLDPDNPWDFQRVAFVMRGAAERGVVYSPEVLARKAKEGIAAEHRLRLKGMQPAQLFTDAPEMIAALNGIEDAALLRQLAPLGEKLRRLNLESLGAKPVAVPTPVATGATSAPMEKPPPGDPAWDQYFRRRAKGE